MIPLLDKNPRVWIRRPYVTWGILVVCVVAWWPQVNLGDAQLIERFQTWGFVPAEPRAASLFASIFLHGGAAHLAGNMLFLWVFADNVEDAMGHVKFAAFYLLCGALATLGHYAFHADSAVPLVGASGAISGVLGAYLILYPKAKILVPILFFPLFLPAWVMIGFWFLGQSFNSAAALANASSGTGTAWLAHFFGFIAGVVLVFKFKHGATPLFGGSPVPKGVRLRR